MTIQELMLLVLRMQAQARQLGEALDVYDGWRDIPGENADYCARAVDMIADSLTGLRDTLRDQVKAASREHIGEEGPGEELAPSSRVYYVCGYCKTGLAPMDAPISAGKVIACACEIEYMRSDDGQWWAQIQERYAHLYRGERQWAPVMDMPRLLMSEEGI